MAHERKAYSISYQISTHKQVFVTLSSCIGLKRNIGGSVLRRVLRICHVTWPPYLRLKDKREGGGQNTPPTPRTG